MAETSIQQRPWAVVARWPEPFELKAAVAHFAAMAYAHHLTFAERIVWAQTREQSVELTNRHWFPMVAAFTAAASMDEEGDWTANRVRDVIADGGDLIEALHEWLTDAGINPAEIGPAS